MLTISNKSLRSAMTLAQLACERRNSIPILGTLRFECLEKGMLSITACNLDQEVTATVPCEGDIDALCLIGHRELKAMLSAIGECQVELSTAKDKLVVKAGAIDADMTTLPEGDFPRLAKIAYDSQFSIGSTAMKYLRAANSCASHEETRYYLNGVYLQQMDTIDAWSYRFTSTDGHRLYCADFKAPDGLGAIPGGSQIIPNGMVSMILSLKLGDSPLNIAIGKSLIPNNEAPTQILEPRGNPLIDVVAAIGDIRVNIRSKLIDGTFPDYTRVIPKIDFSLGHTELTIMSADLRRGVHVIAGAQSERTRAVKLTSEEGALRLSANSIETGIRAGVRMECVGKISDIGFNSGYLLNMIDAIGGKTVAMQWSEKWDGGGFGANPTKIVDPDNLDVMGVLMPMRI